MGLSVVHGIVKSYQGEIFVNSEAGQGTTMTALLPAVENIPAKATSKKEDLPKGTEHILFIDDESALVDMGASQLRYLGYKVSSRTSSLEALAFFRHDADTFDLVITDMTMPNMTGDELCIEIKLIRPEIPVILTSGFSSKITSENARDFNLDAFIMKPIILSDMARVIRKVLDDSKKA
jgi:CheY-like chemotaxis protein